MNTTPPRIRRPALLGALALTATAAMLAACVGLMGLARAAPQLASAHTPTPSLAPIR